jgi:hypothetical protein
MKKNIHILPTDKPSKLFVFMNKLMVIGKVSTDNGNANRHIYITSDGEIKEGDWCYYLNNAGGGNIVCQAYKHPKDERMLFDDGNRNRKIGEGITPIDGDCKKIVLTTDSILIKDGVQAIPNDFLEFLVQNPSCERVEVELFPKFSNNLYGIIIPKEEPKQKQLEELAKDFYSDENQLMERIAFKRGYTECKENMYSEEEVMKLWNWLNDGFIMRKSLPTRYELIDWFKTI